MGIRAKTLWKIPAYCWAAGWVSFHLTVYLGRFFFVVKSVGADGVTDISIDPVRSAMFHGALFLAVLLIGGLWVCRGMNRKEIAASAAIFTALDLGLVLAQICIPNFPTAVSCSTLVLALQEWPSTVTSLLAKLTGSLRFSAIAASLTPFLFVLFGKRSLAE